MYNLYLRKQIVDVWRMKHQKTSTVSIRHTGRRAITFQRLKLRKPRYTRMPAVCMGLTHSDKAFRIASLGKQLRDREISAVELASHFLQRIQRTNTDLNSFIFVDTAKVLEQAILIDDEFSRGIDRGPLAGIPIAVKDNICTKDFATTAGSKSLEAYYPSYDASVVRTLRQAGAIIIGKTNLDEFGMGSTSESSAYKFTRNPWDQTRTPGGSSGGSAVAVAAQQCVASLGSDTGGSVRQPASHCGVIGFKPTYGVLSRDGLISYASSFDSIGTLTSCVQDSAILFDALTSEIGDNDLTRMKVISSASVLQESGCMPLKGLRFGIVKEALESGIEDDILSSFNDSVELMRRLGAHVEDVSCASFINGLPAYYILAVSEASSNLARYDGVRGGSSLETEVGPLYSSTRAQLLGDEVKRRILMGTYTLSAGYADAYYERAHKVRQQVSSELQSKLRNYDALLTPVATTVAPKLTATINNPLQMYAGDAMTVNVNLSGLPALVVRGRHSTSGTSLPIGLQLIGRAFDDRALLNIGSVFERHSSEYFDIRRFPEV